MCNYKAYTVVGPGILCLFEKGSNKLLYSYSGVRSKVTNSANVVLEERHSPNFGFATHITYSVIDEETIKSHFTSCKICNKYIKRSLLKQAWKLYFHQIYVEAYYFYTLEYAHFVTKSVNMQAIYSGRGAKSKLLKHRYMRPNYIYQSSSFQIVLYIYKINANKTIEPFSWTVKHNTIDLNITLDGNSSNKLSYPDEKCSKLCIILLRATIRSPLKVTVIKMMHLGDDNTIRCKYSGFSTFQNIKETYSKISTTCIKPDFMWLNQRKEMQQSMRHPLDLPMAMFTV